MSTLVIPKPNPKQLLFLKSTARQTAFGGARGGGKSWSVRVKATLLCCNYAGIKVLIVRRTFPELVNNHINPLLTMLHGIAKYNKNDKVFQFGNGSTIKFGYLANDSDMNQYQGAEYDIIFLDEATQFSEEHYKALLACNRGVNDFPKRFYLTCNPGGKGHGWVKRLFIDRKFTEDENPEDYTFIQSLVTDNEALMAAQPEYLSQLKSLPEKLRKAWLYGDWNIFEGQFFEDFIDNPEGYDNRKYTHVINPFEPDPAWTIVRSYDFGYSKPFSCAWWAVDFQGRLYRILELYGCTSEPNVGVKWTPDKQFEEIHKIETTHPWLAGKKITGVADPAIWDTSRGESIAETSDKHYVHWTPGDNSRIAGWMQMHYRFQFDENGYPMMYVFNTCKAFIRCCPLMVYDEHKTEDLDTSMEDHCLAGDTIVYTDKGYSYIRDLVGTEGKILSHDGKFHDYYDCRMTRKNAPLLEIELEDGTKIRCTDDHRFMLPNGKWIHANELMAGDEVKTYGSTSYQRHDSEV